MQPTHSLTVISLGGGVQSSVMALMASGSVFGQLPDCAIFADTHWEPPSIYPPHLEWLAERLAFPLYIVDNGRSLREDAKALTNHSGNRGFIDLPVYLKGRDGEGDGMGRRQCIEHYKIAPVRRKMRELLGLSKGQRVPTGTAVELWLGISTDEAIRIRPSRDGWIRNRYPLIEAGMSRKDCMEWWQTRYDRPLERSACIAAPTSLARNGSRRSAGGRSCSPTRWRSTPNSEDGWPSPRSPTCILYGCPSRRRSALMKRGCETASVRMATATSARGIAASERRSNPLT